MLQQCLRDVLGICWVGLLSFFDCFLDSLQMSCVLRWWIFMLRAFRDVWLVPLEIRTYVRKQIHRLFIYPLMHPCTFIGAWARTANSICITSIKDPSHVLLHDQSSEVVTKLGVTMVWCSTAQPPHSIFCLWSMGFARLSAAWSKIQCPC